MSYLEQAEFGSAALIRTFDLRYDLLSALVERWRPETHTFHFQCGECMVTLEDVALQLGLPIDGSPVTGVTAFIEPVALCYQLLGDSPNDDESNFTSLKFTWLKAKFGQLSANATEADLTNVRSYSWGSAVLAVLYRELCRTTKPSYEHGRCLTLSAIWRFIGCHF
ncbi:protein MAINTENANCE OF MERISTEMS-like [Gossypium raimondii]|uniref:protein MAINTENANCE OF MERISTEMS-like n=1 Tax=Gossypium raimondii TaxID=29730 RepID=UPI00227B74D9|nr:protein MAINTENANCE OF MERISTEMS-like [Gossypium raimondii]